MVGVSLFQSRLGILIIFCLVFIQSFGQFNDNDIRLKVLKLKKVGKEYRFLNPKDSTNTYLKYLGELKSVNGSIYKIVTSVWIWGISNRATNRILIYNIDNKYIGNYKVSGCEDLPEKINNNKIVFTNAIHNDCDSKLNTLISFSKGIPKEIFLKCKGKMGTIYSFSNEE